MITSHTLDEAARQRAEAFLLQGGSSDMTPNRNVGAQQSTTPRFFAAGDDAAAKKAKFQQWARAQSSVRDSESLAVNLQRYLKSANAPSMAQVEAWLAERSPRCPSGAGGGHAFNTYDELRRCLMQLKHSSEGTVGFTDWMVDSEIPPSPASVATQAAGEDDAGPGNAGREEGHRVARPNLDRFFTMSSVTEPINLGAYMSHTYMSTYGSQSGKQPSAYVSGYLHRARSALMEDIPETDAAAMEVAAWGSSEDDDFVTPWYTYAMRVLMVPLAPLIFYFIYWRFSNIPANGAWWADALAWIFIISEASCFLFGMTHWVWMWNLKFRKRVTQAQLGLRDADLPTIDIMIPCYSEPTEIVEMTLKACYDMDYPEHKIAIYVCDDGKKEEMREMVELNAREYKGKMKTRYIARIKTPGVPHHAKAGNLNNCILNEGSTGQLIIILDCDMLPEPCMARTVAPFFYKKPNVTDMEAGQVAEFDDTVGLLQTPQAFYNLDSKDLLGQSYGFFYECQMSGWDGSGCTPCCGTGVTFNRNALVKVGGFSVGSITEDFKTSLNLCSHGYQCKYFLQRMTRGVSPKELNAFMVQRLRWAVGAIQILRAGNPLFISGLHLKARWLYFWSTVGITYIIPVVAMGLIMYTTLIAGFAVSFGPTTFTQYLYFGGTTVFAMMVMQYLAGWRLSLRDYLRAMQDNFTVFATLLRAIAIGFLGMEMGFAVTNKDVSFDLKANLYHAAPHLFVYLLSGVAMFKAVTDVLAEHGIMEQLWSSSFKTSLLYFSMLWTVFLWVMISNPPRMVLYGWLRSRREAKAAAISNPNVPALQELPNTPMNTFPPLEKELWAENNRVADAAEYASTDRAPSTDDGSNTGSNRSAHIAVGSAAFA